MESLWAMYIPSMLKLAAIAWVATISPGPDFAIVARNSLIYSRKTALFTAAGIAAGIAIHVFYILAGLEFVLENHPWLLQVIQYGGASYLLYLGIMALRSSRKELHFKEQHSKTEISHRKAFGSGLLTSFLSPNAPLFFIALFTNLIPIAAPPLVTFTYGFILVMEVIVWYGLVAYFLTAKWVQDFFSHWTHVIDRIAGIVFIALALQLFWMNAL